MLNLSQLNEIKSVYSLQNSRKAIQFLYEESLSSEDPIITQIIGEALIYCEYLIRDGQENLCRSEDAFLYFCFLRSILGLQPQQIEHLIAVLKWMNILPADEASRRRSKIKT